MFPFFGGPQDTPKTECPLQCEDVDLSDASIRTVALENPSVARRLLHSGPDRRSMQKWMFTVACFEAEEAAREVLHLLLRFLFPY